MVKHIVLWKIKDGPDKQQNIDRMIKMLKALVGRVEGLVSVEIGYNFTESSDYDVTLYATLKSPAALRHYQNHPAHIICKQFIASIAESRAASDYFYEEETVSAKPADEVADVPETAEKPAAAPVKPKEPEIWIERPPKRTVIPAPQLAPKTTDILWEDPASSAPYVPSGRLPEITVRKAPLWEPEVFPAVDGKTAPAAPAPMRFEDIPAPAAPAPMRFEDIPAPAAPAPMRFEDIPAPAAPAPMRFEDIPAPAAPAPMRFEDIPAPAAPKASAPARTPVAPKAPAPAKTPVNAQVNPVSTEHSVIKEKTNAFGKKKLDVEVTPLEQRSDTWTCPNCGKVMPNYVGTCGCGEPKPFEFDFDEPAPAAPKASAPARTPAAPKAPAPAKTPVNAQVNPVSTEHSVIKEKTNAFGKKKLDVEVTPLEQRSDTWTCPNCGKVMPNYVGTCGCGEPKPFEFYFDEPAPAAPKASAPARTPAAPKAPAPAKTPVNAQVNPVSTEHSVIKEKTNAFGKKKLDVEVTPLEQRSDTWTCPNCGKVMPNYVGTCGCGEPKPFEFDFDAPAPAAPKASAPARTPAAPKAPAPAKTPVNAQVNPVSTEHSVIKEKTNAFGKKKLDVEVTPLEQRSDTWTCPNCGKVMPNYVGTCGCGEPKPFEFDFDEPAPAAPKASTPARTPAAPKTPAPAKTPVNAQVNPVSTEHSVIKEKTNAFGKKKLDVEVTPLEQRSDTWTCPNCGKVMPNYVGTCGCGEPKPFEFDFDEPAPAAPKASAPARTPAAPKAPAPAKAPVNAQVNPVSTEHSVIKEKTNAFGKKKLDVEVTPLEQRSDTWTCPNCGKVMPNYVGTCGCGEPKPFEFDFDAPAPAAPKASAPAETPAAPKAPAPAKTPVNAQVNPVSTEHSVIKEKTNAFGKKKLDVEVTPLEQRSDTWTCPNCGKVMPNYVGTCGCGEPKPFEFDFDEPAPAAPKASAPAETPAAPKAPAPAKTPVNAQVNPVSTEHSVIKEKTNAFGKKKLDVEVTPLEQRSDTWTCPNCGKVMPNYVGTCGCGEPKPFAFDFDEPAPAAPKASAPARTPVAPKAPAPAKTPVNAQVNPVSTEHSVIKEKTNAFGKKKLDVEVTPLEQRSDTWTCPNCGKVMPNYVGTCGCGEPKPFAFDFDEAPMPAITPAEEPKSKLTEEQMSSFDNVHPSIQGYNPQVKTDVPTTQGNTYSYIQNDTPLTAADPNYKAPDLSFIRQQENTFNHEATNQAVQQDFNKPLDPFNFDNAPAPAPMRFDDLPPAAPMRFSDEPPAFLGIQSTPPAHQAPSAPAPQPPKMTFPEYQRPPVDDFASTKKADKKKEKKPRSKKAKEAALLRQAQEQVNNRKDVPNDGTWTCPNCGKVMPKYVGTCGCGEPQPFEF